MKYSRPISIAASAIVMSLTFGFALAVWQEPSVAPPNGNVSAPVNIGGTAQTKAGSLSLTGDFYAPIFYDNDNSNWYVNPASQTVLAGPVIIGATSSAYQFDVQGGQVNVSGGLCIAGDCKTAWNQVGGNSYWTQSGSDLYASSTSWNVGIGTTTPNNLIQVKDLINFSNSTYSTFLGYQAGYANAELANTAVGYKSFYSNTTGYYNTASGAYSLYSNTNGYHNVANGVYSLYSNTEGYQNTASGAYSLYSNTTGTENTASGAYSLYSNKTGRWNTANGAYSLYSNTEGRWNTANGAYSLYSNISGVNNTANGAYSMYYNDIGYSNVASGAYSLYSNTEGRWNTANGAYSLYSNTEGVENTAVGANALYYNATGSGNVALGYNAGRYETGSNSFYVDDRDRGNTAGDKAGALLYGIFNDIPASQTLRINAGLTVSTLAGTGSRTVVASAAGLLSAPTSDARLKTNFVPIGGNKAMAMLEDPNIFGINFNWKDPNRGTDTELGFTSQMFEPYKIPGLTFEDNGIKGLNYDKLTVILWEQNKEKEKQIEYLANRIEALEKELEKLRR